MAVAVAAGAVALLVPASDPRAVSDPVQGGLPPAPPAVPVAAVPDAAGDRVAAPTSLTVPSIGVQTSLAPLGVDASGALVPPAAFDQAGWFVQGPAPGEVGPAVLAGHVDSTAGPAVFFRLEELTAGDEVLVGRSDGTTVRFVVTRVARYPKAAFGTAEVYGPTPDAQLRLITCGGAFDRSRRSYTDNTVVFARQAP
jgi:sortase (surface protein transpeptidase)